MPPGIRNTETRKEFRGVQMRLQKEGELRQAYKDFEALESGNTSGWEYLFQVEDWNVYRRQKPGSQLYEYMTFGYGRKMDMQLMYQVYMDLDYVKHWHAYCKDVVPFEAAFEGEAHLFVIRLPFPLANREYAFVRHTRQMKRNGRSMYFVLSHTTRDCLEQPKKTERNAIRVPEHRQVIVMEENPEDPERPLVFMYYFDDPGGSIPSWIVNWVAKTAAPKYLSGLRKAMQGYEQWRRENNRSIPFVEPERIDLKELSDGENGSDDETSTADQQATQGRDKQTEQQRERTPQSPKFSTPPTSPTEDAPASGLSSSSSSKGKAAQSQADRSASSSSGHSSSSSAKQSLLDAPLGHLAYV